MHLRAYLTTAVSVALGCCLAPSITSAANIAPPAVAQGAHGVDLNAILASTSAVVDCDVTNITETYDDVNGPRTVVTCANVASIHGAAPGKELQLSFFGGALPNGKYLVSTSVPKLSRGVHYALFLDGSSWFYTPVISGMALRVEQISGSEVLLNEQGQVLTGVAPNGLQFSATSVLAQPETLAPGADRFTALPLVSSATVSGAVIDRKALGAAIRATLSNTGATMSPSFARLPASGRAWNRIDVATAK